MVPTHTGHTTVDVVVVVERTHLKINALISIHQPVLSFFFVCFWTFAGRNTGGPRNLCHLSDRGRIEFGKIAWPLVVPLNSFLPSGPVLLAVAFFSCLSFGPEEERLVVEAGDRGRAAVLKLSDSFPLVREDYDLHLLPGKRQDGKLFVKNVGNRGLIYGKFWLNWSENLT